MNNDQFMLLVCGVAGVLFHCLVKLQGLLTDARAANINFNAWKDYWVRDAISIFISLLSVGIWYLVYNEVTAKYAGVSNWTRISFVASGAIGSYVIQLILSRAKKKIRQVVDQKTNAADGTSDNITKLS